MKNRPISKVASKLLLLVLTTLSKKISDVELIYLKPLLSTMSSGLERLIRALSDDNFDNKAQLKEIQMAVIRDAVTGYHNLLEQLVIDKLQDQQMANGALLMLHAAKDLGLALTDENPHDKIQAMEILEKYDVPLAAAIKNLAIAKLGKSDNNTLELISQLLELIDEEELLDPEPQDGSALNLLDGHSGDQNKE